jgi:hypothetical protein
VRSVVNPSSRVEKNFDPGLCIDRIVLALSNEIAMATLYVQNVPDNLYEALRRQAQQHR